MEPGGGGAADVIGEDWVKIRVHCHFVGSDKPSSTRRKINLSLKGGCEGLCVANLRNVKDLINLVMASIDSEPDVAVVGIQCPVKAATKSLALVVVGTGTTGVGGAISVLPDILERGWMMHIWRAVVAAQEGEIGNVAQGEDAASE